MTVTIQQLEEWKKGYTWVPEPEYFCMSCGKLSGDSSWKLWGFCSRECYWGQRLRGGKDGEFPLYKRVLDAVFEPLMFVIFFGFFLVLVLPSLLIAGLLERKYEGPVIGRVPDAGRFAEE